MTLPMSLTVVAPVSVGKIQKDDILVDNFNNISNLQGLGTTIVDYHPATKQTMKKIVSVSSGASDTRLWSI